MHTSTKKWLFIKISSLILIPLMIWFVLSFVAIYDGDFRQIVSFFSEQPSKIIFSIFIVIAFFFSSLTISEIFEDYLHDDKIKNVANKVLYLFAILVPLLTIFLFNPLTHLSTLFSLGLVGKLSYVTKIFKTSECILISGTSNKETKSL